MFSHKDPWRKNRKSQYLDRTVTINVALNPLQSVGVLLLSYTLVHLHKVIAQKHHIRFFQPQHGDFLIKRLTGFINKGNDDHKNLFTELLRPLQRLFQRTSVSMTLCSALQDLHK